MTSISNAMEQKRSEPTAVVAEYETEFASMLPSHIEPRQWVRSAIASLRRDPKLMQAARNDVGRLMTELGKAARLGLVPGTEEYYLTVRAEGKGPARVKKIMGITGYQGLIELIYRAGAAKSVIAEIVRANDRFDYHPGRDERPTHTIDWDSDDRGPLRLAYAFAVMEGGATSKVVVLTKSDIDHIKESSMGSDSPHSPWNTDPAAMWLKSAVRQLAKWVPTSAEYRREMLRAVRDVNLGAPDPSTRHVIQEDTGEGVDPLTGEIVAVIDDEPVEDGAA
ncbi:RecT-like ssDNA annealing protein [Propionibacterium phage PFR2]|uniref:RecT n=2 Tax=Pulverervirus PFR1 TaxID=2170091 RepID=A0A173G9I3_9CAUD|nr:recombinase RecT [Propionibacterium freudenreichii]YP_009287712.1 RecT-like ssDNA annealing protein [Propionibacterium phage PFR1]YP_009290945.1 RecT-like ssDNA annealing protein [Propionibacterium phage PFR2]ANH49902.1 hypothetical protein PFR1_36 [Propionibacterium phage PFR1]ANH49961.1 hypothetical protein PFR2_36 [Propionibacterium phage PFR2]MDK9674411.1 recombinase RecT [Propionibacterium freudenreichii]CEI46719.1 RecT protein [Propionibacterium freudenreichii]SCQ46809.1 Recombinase